MGIVPFILGVGVLLAPNIVIKTTTVPNDVFMYQVWGGLWAAAGLMIILGITKLSYNFVRSGLAALMAVYGTFAVSALVRVIVTEFKESSLFTAIMFMMLALISMALLREPPINPETAVESKDE